MRRLLGWLLILPLALIALGVAMANRHRILLSLDPFRPEAPAFAFELPLYVLIFATVALGIVLGGAAVWLAQAPWRRAARDRGRALAYWETEARALRERERKDAFARARGALPAPARGA